jgi:MFS family permease
MRSPLSGLTRNVYVLGAVSLFTDISSEMIVPVRILFLVGVLNTPLALAGLIEGLAESATSVLKVISGQIADRASARKPLIVFGYTVSNLVKPLMALAGSWPVALGMILIDRAGKGARGSPRDAILADSTEQPYLGKAFGFHRAMDTLGAAIGPLLTFAILAFSQNDLRQVFLWTAVPGILSVIVLVGFLREPTVTRVNAQPGVTPATSPRSSAASLGPRFWLFTAVATVFALGNSSDAFIFLRTEGLEHSLEAVPLVYFGYNLVYALLATPLGSLSDRWGRLPVLVAGYTAFGLVYAGWAAANQPWHAYALFLLYGIYAAATEGIGRAMVADVVPRARRGTALGWFNGMTGLAALPANLLGGWLWSTVGPSATFALGAWLALVAAALLVAWSPWLLSQPRPAAAPTPVQIGR